MPSLSFNRINYSTMLQLTDSTLHLNCTAWRAPARIVLDEIFPLQESGKVGLEKNFLLLSFFA